MDSEDETKRRIQEDRKLMSEQEYAESLAKDLARKAEREKARIRGERSAQIEKYRASLKGVDFSGPHRVLIRYPDGQRRQFGFCATDVMERLFDAILSHPSCPTMFFVRSIYPKGSVACFPVWYAEILIAETSDDENEERRNSAGLGELKSASKIVEVLPNQSILFVNTMH